MSYHIPLDYCDIYIEPNREIVTVRQRWKYSWWRGDCEAFTYWTYQRRKAFHDAADRLIWNHWSNNYFLMAYGEIEDAKLIKDFRDRNYRLVFDIQWVLDNPHWTVNVVRQEEGYKDRSSVKWNSKEVWLNESDLRFYDLDCDIPFNTVLHEYTHTLYNDDEYGEVYGGKSGSRYEFDYRSLQNIGVELRDRFVTAIEEDISYGVPGVSFSLLLTQKYVNSIDGRH
ncbi:hypothetical protein ABN763_11095 [Spongiivirga sp. MCCC 1A20706]|uniref:hypothetical protein n=1 Tax=Spongiivirga sp. MCCC 1A20706 TaxID=3160963 RepID=UPI0039772EE2